MTGAASTAEPAVTVALDARDLLGEGPWWDERDAALVRVDIRDRTVHRWAPESGATSRQVLPEEVSLALPRASSGLVVTQVDRVCLLDPDGVLEELTRIDADSCETRLNDGVVDPSGRLWVGTYSPRSQPEAGLYVVEPNGTMRQVLDGLIASNGLAWDASRDLLYAVDTGRGVVDRFRPSGTALEPLGPLVQMDIDTELPDGITLDADGGVWVAVLGAAEVRRYLPNGCLDRVLRVPVSSPTAVAFGGAGLEDLFITSSSYALPPGHGEPAGSVLRARPGVTGTPVRRFAG